MNFVNFKNFLKRYPANLWMYQKIKKILVRPYDYTIPEITALTPKKSSIKADVLRINLLLPSIDKKHVFGGISTAIEFFEELRKYKNWNARLIITDSVIDLKNSVVPNGYVLLKNNQDDRTPLQVLSVAGQSRQSLPVRENDVFVATIWWSAYIIADVIRWQSKIYHMNTRPLLYIIQDYEPGFYPWSSRYLLADSTYHLDIPTLAVMNTELLKNYFEKTGYSFTKIWTFEPKLSDSLKSFLPKYGKKIPKKKQILVYGRPSVARNAFELLVYALKIWVDSWENAREWTIISAGERHGDINLGRGIILHSVGKLSIEDYASMLLETYAGISLMVSPHPSYPPLEMAAFGIHTITNCYTIKDLSSFSENIISLKSCGPNDIANALHDICSKFNGFGYSKLNSSYAGEGQVFHEIISGISEYLEC